MQTCMSIPYGIFHDVDISEHSCTVNYYEAPLDQTSTMEL